MNDPQLPEYLHNLWKRENEVYDNHRVAALSDQRIRSVLDLVQDVLDFMIEFADGPLESEDAKTISAIAGRIFNTTAGALREALNGYPQTSFLLQRDLMEIHTLLDVFSGDLALIDRWRVVTNDERLHEFSPRKLRHILKKRDGDEIASARKKEYTLFSEHAAHLTYPALRLLQLPSGGTQLGPRIHFDHIRECLFELGRQLLLAAAGNVRVMFLLRRRDGAAFPAGWEQRLLRIRERGSALYADRS